MEIKLSELRKYLQDLTGMCWETQMTTQEIKNYERKPNKIIKAIDAGEPITLVDDLENSQTKMSLSQ